MDDKKAGLMRKFVDELPVLRAKMRITQDALCAAIGISRQTYTAVECKRRLPSWNVFMLLYLYFNAFEDARKIIQTIDGFDAEMREYMKAPEARGRRVSRQSED